MSWCPLKATVMMRRVPALERRRGLAQNSHSCLLNACQAQLQECPKVTMHSTHGFMDLSTSSIWLFTVSGKQVLFVFLRLWYWWDSNHQFSTLLYLAYNPLKQYWMETAFLQLFSALKQCLIYNKWALVQRSTSLWVTVRTFHTWSSTVFFSTDYVHLIKK